MLSLGNFPQSLTHETQDQESEEGLKLHQRILGSGRRFEAKSNLLKHSTTINFTLDKLAKVTFELHYVQLQPSQVYN